MHKLIYKEIFQCLDIEAEMRNSFNSFKKIRDLLFRNFVALPKLNL